jgi:hypothetical protein
MIIFWRGIGGVAVVIPIIVCLTINIVTSRVYDEANYFQAHLWPKVAALWITGVCVFLLGRYVNGKPPRVVVNRTTGKETMEKPYHHLMFIKLEYWGLIFVAIGLVLLLINLASK